MPIIFARVDDRLIHGQIVQAWLPELTVDEVLIPCQKGKESYLNRGLLRLSLPYEYDLSVLDFVSAARYVASSKKRIFLLMANLQEAKELIANGVQLKSLNIGGMHFKEGAQKLADHVFLDEKDKQFLRIFRDLGVSIETRAVPNSSSISISEALL